MCVAALTIDLFVIIRYFGELLLALGRPSLAILERLRLAVHEMAEGNAAVDLNLEVRSVHGARRSPELRRTSCVDILLQATCCDS